MKRRKIYLVGILVGVLGIVSLVLFAWQHLEKRFVGIHQGRVMIELTAWEHEYGQVRNWQADRWFVQLTVKGNVKSVDDSTPPFPVVMTVEPTEKSTFDAVVFTQYVQQPKAQTLSVDETFTAPVGHTLVFDAGSRTHAVHKTSKVAVLGDLPLLQCLFSKESTVPEEEHVLILVTPRIVGNSN